MSVLQGHFLSGLLLAFAAAVGSARGEIITEALPVAREMEPYGVQLQVSGSDSPIWVAREVELYDFNGTGQKQQSFTNVVDMSCEGRSVWVLQEDGIVKHWSGSEVAGLSGVLEIESGYNITVALKRDRTVDVWGYLGENPVDMPERLQAVSAIAAGNDHGMALSNRRVVAWGSNDFGQCDVPDDLQNVKVITAAYDRSLALLESNELVIWGDDEHSENVPVFSGPVEALACGLEHNLALLADGTVVAWGGNSAGQCDVPPGLSNVVEIDARRDYSVALKADGSIVAWGDHPGVDGVQHAAGIEAGPHFCMVLKDESTQLPEGLSISNSGLITGRPHKAGVYDVTFSVVTTNIVEKTLRLVVESNDDLSPVIYSVTPLEQKVSMSEGSTLPLGISAHDPEGAELVYRWTLDGRDVAGELGNYSYMPNYGDLGWHQIRCYASEGIWQDVVYQQWDVLVENVPLEVTNETLTAGVERMPYYQELQATNGVAPFTLRVASQVEQWGDLGDQYNEIYVEPPLDLNHVVAMDTGCGHYLALLPDGTVRGWGRNDETQADVPDGLTNVVAVSAGAWHSLALKDDGTIAAWGGDNYNWPVVPPATISNAVAVAGGGSFSLALMADGSVYEWNNSGGHEVANVSDVMAIAGGWSHALALRVDGTVVAWGREYNGACDVPEDLNDVVAISAGYEFSLALKADGTVVAWGGYLLHSHSRPVPMYVPDGLSDVVAISAGYSYALALKSDGSVVTWGNPDSFEGSTAAVPGHLTGVHAIAAGYTSLTMRNPSTQLPVGLNLSPNGTIDGVPSEVGTNVVTFIVEDARGETAEKTLEIAVEPHPNQRPVGQAVSPRDGEFLATYGTGQEFEVWARDPEGDALEYRWVLDGIQVGSNSPEYYFDRSLDELGINNLQCFVSDGFWMDECIAEWNIAVSMPIPQIENVLLPVAEVGAAYHVQLTATNGTAPYRFFTETVPEVLGYPSRFEVLPGEHFVDLAVEMGRLPDVVGLKADGSTVTWSRFSREDPPLNLPPLEAVECGFEHTVALARGGSVVAWGDNSYGQCDVPLGLGHVVAVAAGRGHSMALDLHGDVFSWGRFTEVPTSISNVVAISTSSDFSMALKSDGTVEVWGHDDAIAEELVPPDELTNVVAISAGSSHCLALRGDGTMVAWGDNEDGQCDLPNGIGRVCEIDAGHEHSLALLEDGQVMVWGDSNVGSASTPLAASNVVEIAAGEWFSIMLQQRDDALPAGLTLSSDGILSGVPTEPCSGMYTFSVRDAHGRTSMKQLYFAAIPHPNSQPPVIDSVFPSPGNLEMGESKSQLFVVNATDPEGFDVTYNWLLDGAYVGAINGYEMSTSWGDAGAYALSCQVSDGYNPAVEVHWQVQVLADNDGDGVINTDELFAGTNPDDPSSLFQVSSVKAGHSLTLRFSTVPGRSYQVLYTDDLNGSWADASGIIEAMGAVSEWTAPGQSPQRFYRVIVLP